MPISDSKETDVLKLFAAAVQEIHPGWAGTIDRDTVIADIGVDSISLMEIVGILEDDLNVKLSDEEITRIRTVGEVERLVARKREPAS